MHTEANVRVIDRKVTLCWWISAENLNHQRPVFLGLAGSTQGQPPSLRDKMKAAGAIRMSTVC
jgi:hypothetical protein